MRSDASRCIDAFADVRVLVIGDPILDRYLEGERLRFCREAPVPNVDISRRHDSPGGAANAAANVRALGAQVEYLGVLGDDPEGAFLRSALDALGVGTSQLVVQAGRRTRAKHRIVAESQLMLSFASGDIDPIDAAAEHALARRLEDLLAWCDALVVSDYGYGIITPPILERLVAMRGLPRTVVVDSRERLAAFARGKPTAVKPNYRELASLTGHAALDGRDDRAAAVADHAELLLERTGARVVAATLDRDGAVLIERGRKPRRLFARPSAARNTAGAGDTFIAVFSLALAAGASSEMAGELAVAAAGVAIGKDGTSCCTAPELRNCFSPSGKLADLETLVERVESYRRQGRRVVFTNGCFDILHRGHVTLLEQAKALGDVLVVAVNADASIRRLKGSARPINTLEDRLQVLAALGCVDHVLGFEEDTCAALVRALKPHVFVKGGDYTIDTLPEAADVRAVGGVVHVLPYLTDRSTTGVIERIRREAEAMSALAVAGSPA
jgi:D-beta-D-heptose 7-phosphate kinase/D-beta-D-heptose 1-phosphate adenosyltransferase